MDNLIQGQSEEAFSRRSLFHLSFFSTCVFIFAALVVQFFLTLQTAVLLKVFSYPFQYSLFTIKYLSNSSSGWSTEQVFFVFVSGPLLLSVIGMRFLWALNGSIISSWKNSLILTWITFLLVHALPCGIIAGAFCFDYFGIAFQWISTNYLMNGFAALLVILILVMSSRLWLFLFLKTSFTPVILNNSDYRRSYFKSVFLKPWIYGMIVLLFFNWPFNSFYWPVFLSSLGFLTIYSSNRLSMVPDMEITDTGSEIFISRAQVLYVVLGLVLIWMAGEIKLKF